MLLLKRSLFVVSIVCLNSLLIGCVPTKVVGKTSVPQPYVSPARMRNNAFATARSSQPAAINERASRANLTSENLLNSEEPSHAEVSNGNFTTDDVQVTLTNDKPIDANLSSVDVPKPFEDEPVSKDTVQNAPSNSSPTHSNLANDNQPISQFDTFNSENLGYNSMPENLDSAAFQALQCASCSLPGHLNSDQFSRCCSIGFSDCCNSPTAANLNSPNNASPNSNPNNQNSPVSNKNASPSQSLPPQSSPPQPSPPKPSSPSNADFYGTKTKIKSPTNKIKTSEQPADEIQDIRQYLPSLQGYNPTVFNPNLLNSFMNQNRLSYANGLNNLGYNVWTGLPGSFHYSNLNSLPNPNGFSQMTMISLPENSVVSPSNAVSNTPNTAASSPTASLDANPSPANSNPNPHEIFSRKTTMPNRMGTKTAGANGNYGSSSISDASVQQSAGDQQQQYGFQSKQQPVVQHNENAVQPNVVRSTAIPPIQPSANQAAPSANSPPTASVQQTIQSNYQRINNRNPNEQTAAQQQGGISNAFNSFISHIPFIGFNPIRIPVIFSSGSSAPQQSSTMTANQVAQFMAGSQPYLNDPNNQNYPYGSMIAIRPQSQNAQLINPSQLAEQSAANPAQNQIQNQSQDKVSGSQAASQQPANNSGFVATIFNRPMALYNRIGGYFTRPFGSNKPALHYANNPYLPVDLNALIDQYGQNAQNMLFYPPFALNQNHYDVSGLNPMLMYLQNEKFKEMARSGARKS